MFKKMMVKALKEVLDIKDDKISCLKDVEEAKKRLEETRNDLSGVKIELQEVKAKKKLEETEIKHLVKMSQEKNEIEVQKKEQKIIGDYQKKELTLMKEHQALITKLLEENKKEMKSMYDKISETLSKAVSVEITKDR